MSLDSDIALVGTGLAPLIAAQSLMSQGYSVLVLNPDYDFFLEDSELPVDPLLQGKSEIKLDVDRLHQNTPEETLRLLRPHFPGAIEFWSGGTSSPGYHDPLAPHVRQRGRLLIPSSEKTNPWSWNSLEDLFVNASDAGLNPQILEGFAAGRRFPGFSGISENFKGLYLPKACDVDIVRYRHGILEFVRERLTNERVICGIDDLEIMPEGIRFKIARSSAQAKLDLGMLVFWTPRMSPWVQAQAKTAELKPPMPKGIRIWEQWLLGSRDAPHPSVIGSFGNMTVWANFEGPPIAQNAPYHLAVLRAGPRVELDEVNLSQGGLNWVSEDSLNALSHLCHGFLKWDKFSIRALKARAVFEWEKQAPWTLSKNHPQIQIIPACDGPLVDVVRAARAAGDHLLKEFANHAY